MYTLSVSKYASETIDTLYQFAVSARRALHAIPELSDEEFETSEYIYGSLVGIGFAPTRILTGMFIDIKGTEGKRKIALRADFDALPITEETGLPFASKNGCMHACGHDAHTAMCLAVAKALSAQPPRNDVRIIFQFGEEGNGGAGRMIEQGVLAGVDMIFALHLSPDFPKGSFATRAGALFAGGVEFDIDFTGESSHAARREQGADALAAAAAIICDMSEVANSNSDILLHFGKITSGSARNVVAGSAKLEGTLRYYNDADRARLMENIKSCCDNQLALRKVKSEISILAHYPPLINDEDAVKLFASKNEIIDAPPQFTAEDFAMYLQRVPGCMTWLGVRDMSHTYPLHSSKFDFDESVMRAGLQALLRLTDIKF